MREKIAKFLPLFISYNAGALSIIIGLGFAIWSSIGEAWYKYPMNFILIFIAGMFIGTNLIQGLTRGFSYLYLYKYKGILKAIIMIIPTVIFFCIAYFILNLVFDTSLQYSLFFIVYIVLSTTVAIADKQFKTAITRTKMLEITETK